MIEKFKITLGKLKIKSRRECDKFKRENKIQIDKAAENDIITAFSKSLIEQGQK